MHGGWLLTVMDGCLATPPYRSGQPFLHDTRELGFKWVPLGSVQESLAAIQENLCTDPMYYSAERCPGGINDIGRCSVAVLCRQELPLEDSISRQLSACFHALPFGQGELEATNLL
jgi:hypothetical protein